MVGHMPRILVADDEVKICELLQRLLTREGYHVEMAHNGADAIDRIVERAPDLLITDLKMPGMDGLELLRRARSLKRDLPVVMITGYASMETAVAALREGIDDYITKPFSVAELKAVVGRILTSRALADENRRLLAELKIANQQLEQHRRRLTMKVREAESDLEAANSVLERQLAEMEVIHEISQMTTSVISREDLLPLVTRLIRDKVGVDSAVVMLGQPGFPVLFVGGAIGEDGAFGAFETLPADAGLMAAALSSPEALLIGDLTRDPRLTEEERRVFRGGSALFAPIRGKAAAPGLLAVGRRADRDPISEEGARLLGLIANDLSAAIDNATLFEENERSYIGTLSALVTTMEARDPYLREHSERVRARALGIAKQLRLSDADLDVLQTGARLHDLGKIGIADGILHKPDALTDEEMDTMRSHPGIGDRIVKSLGKLQAVKPIIRHHHERWDGQGYPDGLHAEDIPLLTQIVTVADAFDAMTSTRPYRDELPREKALAILDECAGSQFSPVVVDAFHDVESERRRAIAAFTKEEEPLR
jgi:putative nucleotidyltransferase with HDIG domain